MLRRPLTGSLLSHHLPPNWKVALSLARFLSCLQFAWHNLWLEYLLERYLWKREMAKGKPRTSERQEEWSISMGEEEILYLAELQIWEKEDGLIRTPNHIGEKDVAFNTRFTWARFGEKVLEVSWNIWNSWAGLQGSPWRCTTQKRLCWWEKRDSVLGEWDPLRASPKMLGWNRWAWDLVLREMTALEADGMQVVQVGERGTLADLQDIWGWRCSLYGKWLRNTYDLKLCLSPAHPPSYLCSSSSFHFYY